jgi:hypothetical protein
MVSDLPPSKTPNLPKPFESRYARYRVESLRDCARGHGTWSVPWTLIGLFGASRDAWKHKHEHRRQPLPCADAESIPARELWNVHLNRP